MAVDDRFRESFAELQRQRAAQRSDADGLKGDGGDGTSGGVTDDWKIAVDRQLQQLQGDVRHLLYALIAGFLLLACGGWIVYDRLSGQLTDMRKDTAAVTNAQSSANGDLKTRDAELKGDLNTINAKLDALIDRRGKPGT